MKTTITPQQALEEIRRGHLGQLKGQDEHGFTFVFDDANEVLLLTYYIDRETIPMAVIKENETEIREHADHAKGAMLQLICGKNYKLSMDDIPVVNMVETLFPEHTAFSWDVDYSETMDYKLRIDLYIVTK